MCWNNFDNVQCTVYSVSGKWGQQYFAYNFSRNLNCLLWFLLLARYVPNVAKRSICDQCKKNYILTTDRRPTNDLTFGKIQMAISPRGVVRSTSCLVLRWGFRGRRIEWRYFRFLQIQDGGSAAILKNSNGDISAVDHPNGANSGLTKFKRFVAENNARGGVIRLVTI